MKGRPLGLSGLCGKWLSGNLCLLQFLQFLSLLVARRASLPSTFLRAPRRSQSPRITPERSGRRRVHTSTARGTAATAGTGWRTPGRSAWRSSRSASWWSTARTSASAASGPRASPSTRRGGRSWPSHRRTTARTGSTGSMRAGGSGCRCAAAGRGPRFGPTGLPSGCGALSAVRGDPLKADVVYVACGPAGLWRSSNFGASFTRLANAPDATAVATTTDDHERVLVADECGPRPLDERRPHVPARGAGGGRLGGRVRPSQLPDLLRRDRPHAPAIGRRGRHVVDPALTASPSQAGTRTGRIDARSTQAWRVKPRQATSPSRTSS